MQDWTPIIFGGRARVAFFDVHVTNVTLTTKSDNTNKEVFGQAQAGKKNIFAKSYRNRARVIYPLAFGTNGGTGNECKTFLREVMTS